MLNKYLLVFWSIVHRRTAVRVVSFRGNEVVQGDHQCVIPNRRL